VFRSGRLTQARLNQIMKRAEATPHNLRIVAKACLILPADLMAWFVAGQDPECRDPLMVELAWKINALRADKAAENYARVEAAANGGKKGKRVVKKDPLGGPDAVEETVEDVLPAAWAIEKLDQMAADSVWEIAPNAEQAEELHRMMRELTPTPLLTSGVDEVEVSNGGLNHGEGHVELTHGGLGNGVEGVIDPVAVGVEGEDCEVQVDCVFHDQSLTDPE